jgi:hypothetical protein
MSRRSALLVGSMPFKDDEDCMRRALDELGPYLFSLPDGEVGERTAEFPDGNRACWIVRAMDILLKDRENWRVVREPVRGANGVPVDYESLHQLAPRCTPEDVPERIRFGYDEYFVEDYRIFRRLRAERGLERIKFQLGIPTGTGLGFAFPDPADRMRFRGAFNTVLAREANAVLRQAGDDVVIQLEMPPETYAAFELPAMMNEISIAPTWDMVGKIDPGAQIGLHLCLGDLRNIALLQPQDLTPLVELSNRLVEGWPEGRTLVYVHYPLAAGNVPPSTDPSFYEPLADVRLPEGTHFVAGFVHEGITFEENAAILRAIEAIRGEPVDVACSCGIGRRTSAVGEHLLKTMAGLAGL